MKQETKTKTDVTGLPSRAAASRLATILLVVPSGVMAFQNDNPAHVELRDAHRVAVVDVAGTNVLLTTKVGSRPERQTSADDREVARRLHRFFSRD